MKLRTKLRKSLIFREINVLLILCGKKHFHGFFPLLFLLFLSNEILHFFKIGLALHFYEKRNCWSHYENQQENIELAKKIGSKSVQKWLSLVMVFISRKKCCPHFLASYFISYFSRIYLCQYHRKRPWTIYVKAKPTLLQQLHLRLHYQQCQNLTTVGCLGCGHGCQNGFMVQI